MTITAYARHRGCKRDAVYRALKRGTIQREPNGQIDPYTADVAWNKYTGQAPGSQHQKRFEGSAGGRNSGNKPSPRREYKERRERAEAMKAELLLKKRAGLVIEIATVRSGWVDILQRLRSRVLDIPSRCAAEIAGINSETVVAELLDRELRQALEEVARTIESGGVDEQAKR